MLRDILGLDYLRDKEHTLGPEDSCRILELKGHLPTEDFRNAKTFDAIPPLIKCLIEVRNETTLAYLYGREIGKKLATSSVSGWTQDVTVEYGNYCYEKAFKRDFRKSPLGRVMEECRKAMSELYGKNFFQSEIEWEIKR